MGDEVDLAVFTSKLADYKKLIDADIDAYGRQILDFTRQKFGEGSAAATATYLDILSRGGKRIRGALTMLGYEMSGGQDRKMILEASRAVEMIHAYILIIDDINDRSETRRGGNAAHILMEDFHKKHSYGGDKGHFGESLAINIALAGNHAAQMILANLNTDPELRLSAINILNRAMITTAHGQINDIINQAKPEIFEEDVIKVSEWKTAYYTLLNPLHAGMVLAGAVCHDTDAISQYALPLGQAFQLSDDILGTFGDKKTSGKEPTDDIKEGKRTLMVVYALEHAPRADREFLLNALGDQNLSDVDFKRCKEILMNCGALDYARQEAVRYADLALKSLDKNNIGWPQEGMQFLRGMARYLVERKA